MISVIIGVLGLLIGSFLNVCIYRLPRKEDIVYTPSHCMYCGERIRWYDLIPIVSYILLGGKCRHCKAKLSIQYPLIELSNGAAYLGIYLLVGNSYETIFFCALFSALLVISVIDYRYKIIPNGTVLFIGVLGIIHLIFDRSHWIDYFIGFFVVSILLLVIAILSKGKLGGGDIKLMAVAGLLIGWKNIVLALFLGSIIGSVIGLSLLAIKKIERKQMIPFGPFLAIGIMVAALFGDAIIYWYFFKLI